MLNVTQQSIWRAVLYGGGSMLLLFNLFFMAKAAIQDNFVPVVPIVAGVFTAAGLLIIVYGEHRAREADKRDHRRISRVAHQLEAPLHSLQEDLARLIAEANKLPAEHRLKLKRMETKSKVLLENIRDVFLTLQAQEGKVSQEVRLYDICTLVNEAISRVQTLARAQNVEITHTLHCKEAAARVDRRLFFIALIHLLENGILYTLKPGLVNVAVIKGKRFVRIVVQDRGVGVKDEDSDAIFQPFARGHAADQFDPDGIGVGLTLSRLIIREFGGTLFWRPRERAAGSQFEIRLPRADLK